jgi:flavoprotein
MAQSAGFPPPRPFNTNAGNLAEEWKLFQQRFQIYITATEATRKSEVVQIALFLSSIGEEAVRIYNIIRTRQEKIKTNLQQSSKNLRIILLLAGTLSLNVFSLAAYRKRLAKA